MSTLNRTLSIDVYARQTIASIGVLAEHEGKTEAAARCLTLASSFDDGATFPLRVCLADMLVGIVEHARATGRHEIVEQAEAAIAAIKAGEAPRLIIGSIDFGAATVGQLDDQLEHIHRIGAPLIEGR